MDLERFLSHVDQCESLDKCWIWQATKWNRYGQFRYLYTMVPSHRWIYACLFGTIAEKYLIHHKCHNRACVNPCHLECVSRSMHNSSHSGAGAGISFNASRTHCTHGHEFTNENTYVWIRPGGAVRRYCKMCNRINKRK